MSQTVIRRLDASASRHADRPALGFKTAGGWQTLSWSDYRDLVKRAARGLIRLGVAPGEGVAIMGFNRPEWFVADLAAIACGGVPAGIYTTSTAEQCAYIADHCRATVAVLENREYLSRFEALRSRLPGLRSCVLMEGDAEGEDRVYSWQELLKLGDGVDQLQLEERIEAQQASDLCTLIYTSGTTGTPKAVMLSHENVLWVADKLRATYHLEETDRVISYLPLSHIAEQVVSLITPITAGASSWFAESLENLGENLREIRPQVFFAVPRVWEKIQVRIQAAGAESSGLKKRIASWARRQGIRGGYARQRGEGGSLLYPLAESLVFSKVRQKLGLDRARLCATSAAPISMHTLEFFLSLGIPILEVYGMSECTGPATFSTLDRYRSGSAGWAIPGTELRIAEDGEILMRGPHLFLGYYRNQQATNEAVDEKGWLHSGDIGELDEQGFLRVTDRKKELIITSGGKNIAPQRIEGKLKALPSVSLPAVIGDRRNYLVALLTLDPERVEEEARAAGSPAREPEAAAECPRFRAHLERQVEAVNQTLARYETIKRFAILPDQFSIDGGELTPTMKLKRRVVQEKYADEIEALYSGLSPAG